MGKKMSQHAAIAKKIAKYMAVTLASLLFLLLISLVALKVFLSVKEEWVAEQVQGLLQSNTGMPWQINGKVGLIFWPTPGIYAENVVLPSVHGHEKPQFNLFQATKLDVRLDVSSIFSGRVFPAEVEVTSPQFIMSYAKGGQPSWSVGSAEEIGQDKVHAVDTYNVQELIGPKPPLEMLPVMDKALAFLFAHPLPALKINDGRFAYFSSKGKLYQDVSNINLLFQTGDGLGYLDFSLLYTAQQANFTCTVDGSLVVGGDTHILQGQVTAGLEIHQEEDASAIRGRLQTSLAWIKDSNFLTMPDVSIIAEGDSIVANLVFDWETLSLSGKGQVVRASLPRWFLFGRILTPELQEVLDGVSGTCDLYIDKQGMIVDRIQVEVGPLQGTGFVRVADFFAPVVEVTVDLLHVNVDNIFPFLAPPNATVPHATPLKFSHRYLVPFGVSVEPYPPSPSSVGYEVNISASSIHVHGADAGETHVRVFPESSTGDARVAFAGTGIFEGSVQGQLEFDADRVLMIYSADSLHLLPLPENMDSDIVVDARLSGQCRIVVPVVEDEWAHNWALESSLRLTDFKLLGGQASGNHWYVSAKGIDINGRGGFFTNQISGVSIASDFNVYYHGAASSWNPTGTDELSTVFEGIFKWPPLDPVGKDTRKRQGIEFIEGRIACNGLYTLPVGNIVIPITGRVTSDVRWDTQRQLLQLHNSELQASSSQVSGDTSVNFSGSSPEVSAKYQVDVNLPKLLADWDMVPHVGINLPQHISGDIEVHADSERIVFDPLRIFVDGMTLKGEVRCDFSPEILNNWTGVPRTAFGGHDGVDNTSTILDNHVVEGLNIENPQQPGNSLRRAYYTKLRDERYTYWSSRRAASGEGQGRGNRRTAIQILESTKALWTIHLYGSAIELDDYIASSGEGASGQPPSNGMNGDDEVPLDLTVLKGLNLDAKLNFGKVSVKGVNLHNVYVDGRIEDSRFALRTRAKDFYGGLLDQRLQGAATAPDTLRVDILALEAIGFNAGHLLNAITGETAYGGTADLGFSISGVMHTRSDFPRVFSGSWHFSAQRGTYPAIIGPRSSGQSHSFRQADASGVMDAGTLRWWNFTMTGPVINMTSRGMVDLVGRTVEANVTVTVARIPTIPVTIAGDISSPSIDIRQTRMLVQTVGAAGSTLLSLVRGVFDLPGKILSTISQDRSTRRESFREDAPILQVP